MVSAKLLGGLGNMLFQIATTYALAWDNNDGCGFEHHIPTRQGNSSTTYLPNVFKKIKFVKKGHRKYTSIFKERQFHYAPIPYKKDTLLKGYYQSPKYFAHHTKRLWSLLEPSPAITKYITNRYPFIKDENTVSLHVRRGDYLPYQHIHPLCTEKYYRQSLAQFKNHRVIILSDDPKWCLETFSKKYDVISGEKDWIDLYIMSMCKHNIIANSSFSWWGAWLNKNLNKRVIAPSPWFNDKKKTRDLYDERWKIIKSK